MIGFKEAFKDDSRSKEVQPFSQIILYLWNITYSIIVCHVYPLVSNDSEISNYTTAVAK
jgi:hypothetical protein